MNKNTVTAEQLYERITFFRSFWEAIAVLGPRNRLLAYEAALDYGLNNVRRQNLPKEVEAILIMIIPQMNASRKRYRDGMKGKEYGMQGAEHGVKGGRPAKEGEIVELNAEGEIDESNL